jgi:hypothetical protein
LLAYEAANTRKAVQPVSAACNLDPQFFQDNGWIHWPGNGKLLARKVTAASRGRTLKLRVTGEGCVRQTLACHSPPLLRV